MPRLGEHGVRARKGLNLSGLILCANDIVRFHFGGRKEERRKGGREERKGDWGESHRHSVKNGVSLER